MFPAPFIISDDFVPAPWPPLFFLFCFWVGPVDSPRREMPTRNARSRSGRDAEPPPLSSSLFATDSRPTTPATTRPMTRPQDDDPKKPIYMYINSTGTTKDGKKLGYDTEAFAIFDTMK